jgi:2-methylisocitrate lyase-like PEP mutase family enzyme
MGFKALASTSAGFAWSTGKADNHITLDNVCDHLGTLCAAVDLPVNADFMGACAVEPEGVAHHVRLCAATGVAGLSVEDSTGDREHPLFDFSLAVERVRAAHEALRDSGALLVARAECFLVGVADPLRESIRRLQAYAEAGADVLYAPGPTKREDIRAIVEAVAPKPVNVLLASNAGLTVADLEELGVRRVSVGGALARAAWTGFIRAAKDLAERGSASGFEGLVPHGELNGTFASYKDGPRR